MIRKSVAIWQGDGPQGKGQLTTQSGALQNQPYSFNTRFQNEDGKAGTNPEELIAAAHAGCFSMALAFALGEAGFTPQALEVSAGVSVEKTADGFSITSIQLELKGRVPEISENEFVEIAEKAKKGCPISKALAAVPINLSSKLL